MIAERSKWLICRKRRPGSVRLFCFPHSGGYAGEYARWSDSLPDVELHAVQLPGRGSRVGESTFTRMQPLVDALMAEIEFRAPFALFGHSKGSLVAYELARALRDRGPAQPILLFASGSRAPHLARRTELVSHLPDEELLAAVERWYGAVPEEVRADPELAALVTAGLRADLAIVEAYRYLPAEPLDCPIVATGGLDDDVTKDELEAWSRHTRAGFDLDLFPGGHFYLREQSEPLLRVIADALRRQLGGQ